MSTASRDFRLISQTAAPPLTKDTHPPPSPHLPLLLGYCELFSISDVKRWQARSLPSFVKPELICTDSVKQIQENREKRRKPRLKKVWHGRGSLKNWAMTQATLVCVVTQSWRRSVLTSSPSSPQGMRISESLCGWSRACSEHLQEKRQKKKKRTGRAAVKKLNFTLNLHLY